MSMLTKFMTFTLISLLFQISAIADTEYEIEVDPSTYALNGYSLHVRIVPNNLPNWRLGAGIYSLEFPDVFTNMNSKNKDQGWNVDLDQGVGFFAEYYFKSTREGWLVGAQIAQQRFNITNENSGSEQEEFTNLLAMPYVGHRWPLGEHFYAQGWFGVGYTENISGETQLGNRNYDIDPVVLFGAVHIGYGF